MPPKLNRKELCGKLLEYLGEDSRYLTDTEINKLADAFSRRSDRFLEISGSSVADVATTSWSARDDVNTSCDGVLSGRAYSLTMQLDPLGRHVFRFLASPPKYFVFVHVSWKTLPKETHRYFILTDNEDTEPLDVSMLSGAITVSVTSMPYAGTELAQFFDSIWTVSAPTDRIDVLLDKTDHLLFVLYLLCFLLMSLFGTAFALFGAVRSMFGRPRRREPSVLENSFEMLPSGLTGNQDLTAYLPDLTAFYSRITNGIPAVEQRN
ncbi:hypothetical protein AAVH_32683 [Aphelenchoides avenae]|nr:hypothetical protein AAVH_32683 [Aphelenchus avenae]